MSTDTPATDVSGVHAHTDLTDFQKHLLFVLAEIGASHGLEIMRGLKGYYGREANPNQHYPSLDTLADCGLIDKRVDPNDARANIYGLTDDGEEVVREEFGWLQERLFPSQRGGGQ